MDVESLVLPTERFPERDHALRMFAYAILTGQLVTDGQAENYCNSVEEVASRKAWRGGADINSVPDVVAETQLRVFGAIKEEKLVLGDTPVAAYVGTVAKRVWINMSKRQGVRDRRETPLGDERSWTRSKKWPPERVVEDKTMWKMAIEQVEQAIDLLPDSQRAIVKLLPTHTHVEICDLLGITDKVLRNRLFRARQKLHRDCPDLFN